MRILVEPAGPSRVDPVVQGSSLPVRVKLSPNVVHVKAGTPLRASDLGWEVAREGAEAVLFATNAGRGGELVNVAREVALLLGQKYLLPCARYRIADVDDTGYVTLAPDPDGAHVALTDEIVLLTPDR